MAVPMFAKMLRDDRARRGFTVGQAAWRLGISHAHYRDLEAGAVFPSFDTWDRMCKLFGWSQSFVGKDSEHDRRTSPVSTMEWPEAQTYLDALKPGARRTMLGILTSSADVRADAIGRLHVRDDGADLAELPVELEEKEWARQWFIERLSRSLGLPPKNQ